MAPYIDFGPSRFKCTMERNCCAKCRKEHDQGKRYLRRLKRKAAKKAAKRAAKR
jgi:hypothetical protein